MDSKSLKILEFDIVKDWLREKCSSEPGKLLAEKLEPSADFDVVNNLLMETAEAESILFKRGSVPLSGIYDLTNILKRAEIGASLDAGSILKTGETLRTSRIVKNALSGDEEEGEESTPIIKSLSQTLYTFRDLEDEIFNAVISEVEISDNASGELRNIRRRIIQKNQSIRSKLNSIISSTSYQKYLQDAIISVRGDRFVVPVKAEYRSAVPGIVHDQSSSGATLFVEPMSIVEMNNDLRQLKLDEKEEIERILAELSAKIGEICRELILNIDILSKLDFIFAKGKLSIKMKGVTPKLNREMKFRIRNGRHPMIDKDKVVANDIYLGDGFNTLVITGPNTGGKTVTIKTAGLFAIMTQSGLNVPADYGTSMCVFDNIFADIGDEQSIEQSLSTFSSHMSRIVDILGKVSEKSLVIFDELGAGTDPTEGAALAIAILEEIKSIGASCIATTHYSELKNYAITEKGVENAAVEFDIDTLSPTYKLIIGVPGKSNAFEISRKLGLPDYIIESAGKNIDRDDIRVEDILTGIEKNRLQAIEDKKEAERIKQAALQMKEEYEQKYEKLINQREKMLEKARSEAFSMTRQTKEELEVIIKNIRRLETKRASKEKNREIENLRKELSGKMGSLQPAVKDMIVPKVNSKNIKHLDAGDDVKVLSLNQDGVVVSADDSKKEAVVQIGIMKMTLPYKSLKKLPKAERKTVTGKTRKIISQKSGNVKREVDLRGMNLEEAIMEVEKYLDDAFVAGHEEVTIIHGVGTGVLKKGLQPILKSNKHVKSVRPGQYGEGGMGVTIVTFK